MSSQLPFALGEIVMVDSALAAAKITKVAETDTGNYRLEFHDGMTCGRSRFELSKIAQDDFAQKWFEGEVM
jgi:hypothetical protein